jgi:hypothetical protein
LPNAFLSHIATDGWYRWVHCYLTLHLFILFYVIGMASFKVMLNEINNKVENECVNFRNGRDYGRIVW